MDLNLKPNLTAPDDIYEALIRAHDGLSPAQSEALNARLILILMNHIGDPGVIRQALAVARDG
jgi:hypothetical protein